MYTIGQVSEMYNLPISTLRYYYKEGFFPNLMRKGNIRYFSDVELEAIRIIECLKQSGLEIKEIKQFFQWVVEGPSSYEKRKELFETANSHFLRTAGPYFPDSPGHIKRTAWDISRAEGTPPY